MRPTALIALGLALLFSCTASDEPPGDCLDDGDCDGVAICTDLFTCLDVQCLDSTQCAFGTFCQFNTCFSGCGVDSDCQSGFTCDVAINQCVASPCTDSAVDCALGQACLPETGECGYPGGLCAECSSPEGEACEADGGTCGYNDGAWRCFSPCEQDDDPPRGFTCRDDVFVSGSFWYGNCDR